MRGLDGDCEVGRPYGRKVAGRGLCHGSRHLHRRRGGARATVAVGRSILVIIWHLLANPDARYHDLGLDYVRQRTGPQRRTRAHVHQLEALGYTVTLTPVA